MSEVSSNHAIALVLPYYGKLPLFFNFFLRSLAGKHLDVLFISDLSVDKHPKNFRHIKMSFDECQALFAEKIGRKVRIDSPRRLCDFRPMYGRAFEKYLRGYDYWAFGDCDLVYGASFDNVLGEILQSDCDVFSLHYGYCSGPFCVMKNCSKVNNLYRSADNLDEICLHAGMQCLAFDELHGDWHGQVQSGQMSIEDCRRKADSFTAIVMRTAGLKCRFEEIIVEPALRDGAVVKMDGNGVLTLAGNEVPLFHFVCAKIRKYFTPVYAEYEDVGEYLIDDSGFYVSDFQKRFRRVINCFRKSRAAIRSLLVNGPRRFLGR